MEEEHLIVNNASNGVIQLVPLSNSHRLQIRRGVLRQTTNIRTIPYNSALSNLRRRQTAFAQSQTLNQIESDAQPFANTTNVNLHEIEILAPSSEIVQDELILMSDDEQDNENAEVLVEFSNNSPTDLIISNGNDNLDYERNQAYLSPSTSDLNPDEDVSGNDNEDVDDNDDDNIHQFFYTSTTVPIINYSSSSTTATTRSSLSNEPSTLYSRPRNVPYHQYYQDYSPLINNNSNNGDDLSIEITLESSQNHSVSTTSRRRHSVISSSSRHDRGLRLSDILNIPQMLYSSLKETINDKNQHRTMINVQCYICLEDFQPSDLIKILNCQHIFHGECISEWLHNHSNCAYCRTPVLIDVSRSSSSSTTTTTAARRRQRTRSRRHHGMTRTSTNNLLQTISVESSTYEQA